MDASIAGVRNLFRRFSQPAITASRYVAAFSTHDRGKTAGASRRSSMVLFVLLEKFIGLPVELPVEYRAKFFGLQQRPKQKMDLALMSCLSLDRLVGGCLDAAIRATLLPQRLQATAERWGKGRVCSTSREQVFHELASFERAERRRSQGRN